VNYFYQITEDIIRKPSFLLNPTKTYKDAGKLRIITLLPESICILTTNGLKSNDFGMIE